MAANREILLKQQDRLLNLVMSQILDQHVAKMLSDVLYECTKDCQVSISPSYIISAQPLPDTESLDSEPDSSVKEETEETDCKNDDTVDMKDCKELGKENINNKTAPLETNNAMGMISAAS